MFSQKHYVKIAKIIHRNYEISNVTARFILKDIVDELCEYFEIENPKFDREKFIKACGIG